MNDWVDANAFFTMGKGLMNGMVPYRDLFEQKGPILYVVYGIGYLISNRTFLGIFLIEVLAFTIFLYFFYKILKLYGKEEHFYLSSLFVIAILLTMPSFVHGGSVEELMLPFYAISIYHFLKLMNQDSYLQKNDFLFYTEGILVGILLWTKYILLGFWIGFVLIISFLLLKKKKWNLFLRMGVCYFLGLLTVSIPILLYFGVHGALKDLWEDYFYLNIFLYPAQELTVSLFERIQKLGEILVTNGKKSALYSFSLVVGMIGVLKDKRVLLKGKKISFFILLFSTFLFNFIGLKNYAYYFYVMASFTIFFGIFVAHLSIPKLPTRYWVILLFPFFWGMVYLVSPNTYFIGTKKESLAQFRFAEIMSAYENPTVLNYGKLDGGFYTVLGILPTEKYFEKINIKYEAYPENKDAQDLAIKEKHTQFVILRMKEYINENTISVPYLHENYEVIDVVYQVYENIHFKYVLYQMRE